MKVLFGAVDSYILFGGTPLLVQTARQLKGRKARVSVITSPRHAKEKIDGKPLTSILADLKVPFVISENIEDDEKVLSLIGAGAFGISIGAAWIFRKKFIGRFKGRLVNCHGMGLPRDRGGGAFSWAIMRGEKKGCALIHLLEEGIDTGDIVLKKEYTLPKEITPKQWSNLSLSYYKTLLGALFDRLEKGQPFATLAQDEAKATYWPRLSTDIHGFIDWSWSAEEIVRFIRAFDEPYAGASTFLGDARVRMRGVSLAKEGVFHPFQAGFIFRIHKGITYVAARDGALALASVVPEGKTNIVLGERFHTPARYLEEAKTFRAVYTPHGLKK